MNFNKMKSEALPLLKSQSITGFQRSTKSNWGARGRQWDT